MATYYVRADGTVSAANKASATSIDSAATALNLAAFNTCSTTGNANVFADNDVIYFGNQGGDFTSQLLANDSGHYINIVGLSGARPKVIADSGNFAVRIGGNCHQYSVRGFECVGGALGRGGLYFGSSPAAMANSVVIQDMIVHDVRNIADSVDYNGIAGHGNSVQILDCTVYDISTDGMWIYGTSPKVSGCVVYDIGQNPHTGAHTDCVQLAGDNSGLIITNNYLNSSTSAVPGQSLLSSAGTGTGGVVENNTIIASKAAGNTALYIHIANATIRRNIVTGGATSIFLAGDGAKAYANIVLASGVIGIHPNTSAAGQMVANNTIIGDSSTEGGVNIESTSVNAFIYNNVITGFAKGIVRLNAGATIQYNCLYNNTDNDVYFTLDGTNVTQNPVIQADYSLGAGSPARAAGVWIAGVRAYDDLPLPLHPDIGAVQDRSAPGRRFGVGGGVL